MTGTRVTDGQYLSRKTASRQYPDYIISKNRSCYVTTSNFIVMKCKPPENN